MPAEVFVEVQHAVFKRRVVGACLAAPGLGQSGPASVHPNGDFIVLNDRLVVGGLLGLHVGRLEVDDFLGIVKLDDVDRLLRGDRMEVTDDQDLWIPLHHDVG